MNGFTKLFLLLPSIASLSACATQIVQTNAYPLKIIMCRDGVDMDALLKNFQLVPAIKYDAINGFAALLDAAKIRNLKADRRILSVEADGPMKRPAIMLPHNWCSTARFNVRTTPSAAPPASAPMPRGRKPWKIHAAPPVPVRRPPCWTSIWRCI